MRYSEYMKLSTRCAVLKQQIDEEMNLISQLEEEPDYGHIMPHTERQVLSMTREYLVQR